MGSVRFTERYLQTDPVTDQEFWQCQAAIDQALNSLNSLPKRENFLAIAGTATTLASWFLKLDEFQPNAIESVKMTAGDLHRLVSELKWRSIQERKEEIKIEPQRADVLLAGAMILWRTMEVLNMDHLRVSTRGLRYGLLLEV